MSFNRAKYPSKWSLLSNTSCIYFNQEVPGKPKKASRMPGHIKKTSGPDPDPSPWLQVTPEMKINNQKKPYGQYHLAFESCLMNLILRWQEERLGS